MGHSFHLHDTAFQPPVSSPRLVLVTGAAGRIGSYFANHHDRERFTLRLLVRVEDAPESVQPLHALGEVVVGDIGDLAGLKRAFAGVHTVVHLAADPSPSATWGSLLSTNIAGTYNVFAAAKAQGVKKVIYASSIHAVSGYPTDTQVKTSEPVNPGDLYGVSKCFGEALGRYMAEQEGVDAICLRIGAFQPIEAARQPGRVAMMDAFVSNRDLHQLMEKCVLADHIRFAVFHGLSDNRFKRLDISDAKELVGYAPQDDFTRENPSLSPLNLARHAIGHNRSDPGYESGLREDL